jgi:NitT/TauT family transport system substrate-binding protein
MTTDKSTFKSTVLRLAGATIAGLAITVAAATAHADDFKLKWTMDWAWQGSGAFAAVAWKKGYFKDEGIDVEMSRGFGSGRVPVDIAAGTYHMGYGDINPVIKFNAENPANRIIAVALIADQSPLVAVTWKDGPIQAPKDFEGKTLAAPDFDAGRQLFPIFAAATGIDLKTIQWKSVKPELREPMLAQKQADGITGFITSSTLSLKKLGVPLEKLNVFYYKNYGADLYSGSIITTPAFAKAHPKVVSGAIRAIVRGLIDTVKDPDMAIATLRDVEPLTDVAIERERLQVAIDEIWMSDNFRKNGFGAIDMERLKKSIAQVESAYGLPNKLTIADVFTEEYLPPKEAMMLN